MKILLAAAVFPGLYLAYRVYREDRIEKEPMGLLVKCFLMGCIAILPAVVLELIFDSALETVVAPDTALYYLVECFLIIGIAEEGSKYVLLRLSTWKHPAFDFSFDGIVYAVCTGVGFAVLENILYVTEGGLAVALVRALTAVPAHTVFGVFMGLYYGQAKVSAARGDRKNYRDNIRKALIIPIFLHGLYDFLASMESVPMSLLFLLLVILLDVAAIKKVRQASASDHPVW